MNLLKARLLRNNGTGTQTWAVWFQQPCPFPRCCTLTGQCGSIRPIRREQQYLRLSPNLHTLEGIIYIYHRLQQDAKDEVRVAYFQDDSVNFSFFQGTVFIPDPSCHTLVPTHGHTCLWSKLKKEEEDQERVLKFPTFWLLKSG